jgi:hypothetical protein
MIPYRGCRKPGSEIGAAGLAQTSMSLVALAIAVVIAAPAAAQTGAGFDLTWHTVDAGGGTSSGGEFACSATVGQPDAGTFSGTGFTLLGGFWAGVALGTECVGDCLGDGEVTIDDLLRMVNIALGTAAIEECPAGDANGDGMITIDEILIAVNNALNGC